MKTNITKIIAAAVLVASSVSAIAFDGKPKKEASMISRIHASGNVEVYISQGVAESVKVQGDYNPAKSLISADDGQLTIASYAPEKLTLIVTVTSLEAIEADGNAAIYSTNRLDEAPLEISLSDSATALLDVNENDLSSAIGDDATLLLSAENNK